MKARTKEQKMMVEWANAHSTLTPRQEQYAKTHCFSGADNILVSRRGCFCTNCKTTWHSGESIKNKMVCPHCGKELDIVNHTESIWMKAYYTVFTTVNNMQVVRWFLVRRDVGWKGEKFTFKHVGTEFLTDNGQRQSIELPRCTICWEKDRWVQYEASQLLRQNSLFARYLTASASYYTRIAPLLKRNGFKCDRKFEGYETDVMHYLLSDPTFESCLKVGHSGAITYALRYYRCKKSGQLANTMLMSDDQRVLIKLANRKHIVFDTKEKWSDYTDYLRDLKTLGKDIHNPSILFPEDFQKAHKKAHDKVLERERQEQHRQAIEAAIQKVEREKKSKQWLSEYAAKFSDMLLTSGDFTIKPLISSDEFKAEADHMHHCIISYYGKACTLLLSIEHCGKKTETAEINLLGKGDIVQCHGVNNAPSKYHNQIVKILRGYMNEFRRRYLTESKQKNTLPVLASVYTQIYQMAM